MASEKISPAKHTTWPYLGAGVVLLLVWLAWWGVSLRQPAPHLLFGSPIDAGNGSGVTTIPSWSVVGVDFQHNYAGANIWLHGGNPYVNLTNDPMNRCYVYPPLTLGVFAWLGWMPPDMQINLDRAEADKTFLFSLRGYYIWLAASVVILVLAAWQSWRCRRAGGRPPLPLVFVIAAALISYPVMFELERGNCDVLPLLAMVGLVGALSFRQRLAGDLLVAVCVVMAAGIKAYPGILIFGLVALHRYRAAIFSAGLLVVKVALLWPAVIAWLKIIHDLTGPESATYYDYSHALAMHWNTLWRDLGLPFLAKIPATPAVAVIVFAVIAQVSWKVFQSKSPAVHAWPYLLWLVATGTLVNKVSMDYNLLYLPFAILAVWDNRDRWWTHVLMIAALVWLQPIYLGIDGAALLLLKFISIALLGQLVVRQLGTTSGESVAPVPRSAT